MLLPHTLFPEIQVHSFQNSELVSYLLNTKNYYFQCKVNILLYHIMFNIFVISWNVHILIQLPTLFRNFTKMYTAIWIDNRLILSCWIITNQYSKNNPYRSFCPDHLTKTLSWTLARMAWSYIQDSKLLQVPRAKMNEFLLHSHPLKRITL